MLEPIPDIVAKELTSRLKNPTIGIGAGPHCDGQVLVSYDVLGLIDKFVPPFVKQYARLGEVIQGGREGICERRAPGCFSTIQGGALRPCFPPNRESRNDSAMRQSEPQRFQFTSDDGLSIACVKWSGDHEPRAVIQIAHGLGEHIGRYADLAETLVRREFAVYGNDHRGHGLTSDPLCFPSLTPNSMQSFVGAFPRLADPKELRKVREKLPIYIFSGSDDPVGQRLEGVHALMDRYRGAGIASIAYEFYPGGRHEMLHEQNRREVFTGPLIWISGILERAPTR